MYGNQLRYAQMIVTEYDGREPLSAWLKNFFREHKQMGSRDRKTLSAIVYSYYRLGHAKYGSIEERLRAAISISPELDHLRNYFNIQYQHDFSVNDVFPWTEHLSRGIESTDFARSHLVQPDLFLRVRPGRREEVLHKLRNAELSYAECGPGCIVVANSTKVDAVLKINRDVVIQDKSSQQTGELIVAGARHANENFPEVWDCCAGSGGKSIMAHDLIPDLKLTATDIRDTIIHTLRQRFRDAAITDYSSHVVDLTARDITPPGSFHLVIADVPCSGSGTWSRTPEQLFFATMNKVDYYSNLQKKVVSAAMQGVKKGGVLVYITCSVFKQENEEIVNYMNERGMKTVYEKVFAGYKDKADTMYGALLTNSST